MVDSFGITPPNPLLEGPGAEGYDPAPHNPPAGDWRDDDGQAIDDYFKAMAQGPQIYQAVQALVDTIKPRPNNRIIRYFANFPNVATQAYPQAAILALPADPNRDSLTFLACSAANNKDIYWHSERFDALADAGTPPETYGAAIPVLARSLVVPNYTGPVWVAPSGIGAAGVCQWWIVAVTS